MSALVWYGMCLNETLYLYAAYGVLSLYGVLCLCGLYGVLSLCAGVCGAGAEEGGISESEYSQGKSWCRGTR